MPVNPPKPVTRTEQAQKVVRPYARLIAVLIVTAGVLFIADYSYATTALVLAGELVVAALR